MSESPDPNESIRVLIVDDHQMFAELLSRVLRDDPDIQVVGTATSAAGAVRAAARLSPAVAVVDYRLPDADGIVTATRIRESSPTTSVLMLTADRSTYVVTAAIEAGCAGFVTKETAVGQLVSAIRSVAQGQRYLSPELLSQFLAGVSAGAGGEDPRLTDREWEVLRLMSRGCSNKEIAKRLVLSLNTVRNHVQSVLIKLGAHSRLEAVAVASDRGMLVPSGTGPSSPGRDHS